MNLHEYSTTVELAPAELFRILNDEAFLTTHMPRTGAAEAPLWLRVDEPETTLSWGSSAHHPGSLDVLPADEPHRSRLTLRLASDDDLAPLAAITAAAVKTVAEDSRSAA